MLIDSDERSLLLIATSTHTNGVKYVWAVDGVSDGLERIGAMITHPEEDYASTMDVLEETWNDFIASESDIEDFTFSRPRGSVNSDLVFSFYPTQKVI